MSDHLRMNPESGMNAPIETCGSFVGWTGSPHLPINGRDDL
jgi:hypothetical protein